MTIPLKYSVGFDCSKDDFKACISLIGTEQKVIVKASRTFNNTVKGFNDAETWVLKNRKEKISVVVVMEATGNYYENLAFFFHQKGYYVSIVLPNKSKKYMESRGIKTKNDPVDARGLSQMGAEQLLKKWEPFTKEIYQLRLLTRQCERLAIYRTQLINQLKSLEAGMYQNEKVKRQIQDMLALAEDQIKEAK
jgi:transposase